jgi:AsmA protein
MSKPVKYFLIAAASFCILIIVGIVTITILVDVESYKPRIERFVTEKTGYPLTLGGDIELSFFPWVGLSLTNLQLDNPEGFVNKNFVQIKNFQARLKLLPLLSRKVEISKFVVDQPEIFLEKSPKGIWNWQRLTEVGKPSKTPSTKKATPPATASGEIGKNDKQPSPGKQEQGGFVLESLSIGEFSITDGRIIVDNQENHLKREVSDFNLQLADVSLDAPVNMTMSAQLDGKPLSLKGSVGPLGSDPGAGKLNLDFAIQALETVDIQTSGYLNDIKGKMTYQLDIKVDPFNLKKLFSSLDLNFPVTTTDPKALEKIGLQATVKGDTQQVVLSNSKILLDDSSINLDLTAKEFSRPDLAFNMTVDSIDLDRYLPPAAAKDQPASGKGKAEKLEKPAAGQAAGTASTAKVPSGKVERKAAVNYDPLRKLVLKGTMKLGKMKVHGGSIKNLALDVAGRNGIFTMNSLGMELYEGSIAATGKLDVQKNIPATALNLTLQNVQIGPLLKDFAQKDIIEGVLKAEIAVNLQGDNADLMKQSLNGKGDLLFQDGALIGLDLAQMVRTIKTGFTLEQQGEKPKTDFAELHAPFSISNGLVNTPETTMRSPLIRATATGNANLVSETLDMKIKPTLVGTIKGQGDEEKRSGLTVPILVGGTFSAPKFRPDVEALVKDRMPTEEELKELIKTGKVPVGRKEELKEEVEQAKGLLKGLFGK